MRLSADINDPAYCHDYYDAMIYLNGVLIENCITADVVKGECLCYVTPLKKDKYGELETHILKGNVKIAWKPSDGGL